MFHTIVFSGPLSLSKGCYRLKVKRQCINFVLIDTPKRGSLRSKRGHPSLFCLSNLFDITLNRFLILSLYIMVNEIYYYLNFDYFSFFLLTSLTTYKLTTNCTYTHIQCVCASRSGTCPLFLCL